MTLIGAHYRLPLFGRGEPTLDILEPMAERVRQSFYAELDRHLAEG
jgi:hypothetical protein